MWLALAAYPGTNRIEGGRHIVVARAGKGHILVGTACSDKCIQSLHGKINGNAAILRPKDPQPRNRQRGQAVSRIHILTQKIGPAIGRPARRQRLLIAGYRRMVPVGVY